jgi:hypothetical protein
MIVFLVVASGTARGPAQETRSETETAIDQVRSDLGSRDRAHRLSAFSRYSSSGDFTLAHTALDLAMRHEDALLQAAALRALFGGSVGFEVSIRPSETGGTGDRNFAATYPRVQFRFGSVDPARWTFTLMGDQSTASPVARGQLSGTVLTFGPSRIGGSSCLFQLALAAPWMMSGTAACRQRGKFDVSLNLKALPDNGSGKDLVIPGLSVELAPKPAPVEIPDDLSWEERLALQNRLQEQEFIAAGDAHSRSVQESMKGFQQQSDFVAATVAANGDASRAISEWMRSPDVSRQRVAFLAGLCQAAPGVRAAATAAFLKNIDALVVRHARSGNSAASTDRATRGPVFSARERIIVRDGAAAGTSSVFWDSDRAKLAVEGLEVHLAKNEGTSTACSLELQARCDDATPGNPPKGMTGMQSCGGTREAVEVDFSELAWRKPAADLAAVRNVAERDRRHIGEILELLARPQLPERLGGLEALIASADPLAIDMGLEAALTSDLAAARSLGFRALLERTHAILLTIDAPGETNMAGTVPGQFGFVVAAGGTLGDSSGVVAEFPGWQGDAAHAGSLELVVANSAGSGGEVRVTLDVTGALTGTFSPPTGASLPVHGIVR